MQVAPDIWAHAGIVKSEEEYFLYLGQGKLAVKVSSSLKKMFNWRHPTDKQSRKIKLRFPLRSLVVTILPLSRWSRR